MDKSEILEKVANNVRDIMNRKSISVAELSRCCFISTGTISKIINSKMSLTLPVAVKVAEGLGVDLLDVLEGIYQGDPQKKERKNDDLYEHDKLFIGIISINNQRITCIKDHKGKIIGTSILEGSLDLVEASGKLMNLISSSIEYALSDTKIDSSQTKNSDLNLVMQSYEIEERKRRFTNFAKKFFRHVNIMSDWQITYLSLFKKKGGISLIVDKGVSLSYRMDKLRKLGGWKFPIYDLGGENWLGVQTIQHTIKAKEGYFPMTKLAKSVLAKFGGRIESIIETCFNSKDADVYCKFVEPLLRSYFTDDKNAKNIINSGFSEISKLIGQVDTILGKKLTISVNGSLSEIYTPMIEKSRLTKSKSDTSITCALLANISTDEISSLGG